MEKYWADHLRACAAIGIAALGIVALFAMSQAGPRRLPPIGAGDVAGALRGASATAPETGLHSTGTPAAEALAATSL